MLYTIALTIIFCLSYVGLYYLFPIFFGQKVPAFRNRSIVSIASIVALSLLVYIITYSISDEILANRILHTFGGGFLAFFMCFLVVKDTGVQITKFQFFIFSILIVTALGVGNELAELVLQEYTGFIFAESINDTWLDLASNTIGILIASAVFTPLIKPIHTS